MACGSGTVPPGQGLCELRMDSRTRLAVAHTHGRLAVQTRDAPLPWGSGLGTLRVPSRKLRLNPPGFEPPGSDT